jgi:hypothetical protein
MKAMAVALLMIIMFTNTCGLASAQDRGTFQESDSDYTAREWLVDCEQKNDKCFFFTRTITQASSGSTNAYQTTRASRKLHM